MRAPYFGQNPKDANEKFRLRQNAIDFIRQRGTGLQPNPPRDLIAQSAPRGVQLTWGLPPGDASDISGWRIYSPDENSLVSTVADRGTRTAQIPVSAGASPPTSNFFVSSINAFGVESPLIAIQGKASAEAGAPAQPSAPPGYSKGPGSDRGTNLGNADVGTGPKH